MSNTSKQQLSNCPRALRLSSTAALLLAFAACGARYELGEVSPSLDPDEPGGSTTIGQVIIDEQSDLGPPVSRRLRGDSSVGDVDGDGYDDWFTGNLAPSVPGEYDLSLVHGGPRLAGDVYLEERLGSFVTYESSFVVPPSWYPSPAGDVDGDGFDDMLFSSFTRLNRWIETWQLGEQFLEYWGEQSAYLLYGGPRGSSGSQVVLADSAVPFAPIEAIQSDFGPDLALATDPDANAWWIDHRTTMTPLGDIDSDGFDDIAYTFSLEWKGTIEDGGRVDETASPGRLDGVTYVFYGSPSRLPADDPTGSASAVLPGVTALHGIGDVDGDGHVELVATKARTLFIMPGRGERLTGSVEPEQGGLGLWQASSKWADGREETRAVIGIGDFDTDGFDDLMVSHTITIGQPETYLFYGRADRLEQPLVDQDADATLTGEGTQGVKRLGDWTGDGLEDLLVVKQYYAGDHEDPLQNLHSAGVVIPGRAQRYAGLLPVASLASAADGRMFTGSLDISPIGDIDGDGSVDVQVSAEGPVPISIKYGSPFASVIY